MDYNNNKRWLKPLASAVSLILVSLPSYAVMKPLDDHSLRDATGQAAFYTTYIAPPSGLTGSGTNTSDFGFFKLGLNATIQLNANIDHLQLGCGGVKGPGCDIDINNVGLSGVAPATSTTRQSTDAVLTNPFIQLAIKNPSSLSTRQLVGFNLGAQKTEGQLTFGKENSATPNGINSFSGYLQVAATVGTTLVNGFGTATNGDPMRTTLNQSDGYDPITGKACCVVGIPLGFTTTSYNLNLLDKASGSNILVGDLVSQQQVITGSRINTATIYATANVRDIALSGKLSAVAGGLINLNNKDTSGTIKNLMVDATINEGLGFFHNANLNGSAASLSLQSQDIKYPGANSVAKTGWWLEFSNPIDIGRLDPVEKVNIPQVTLNASLAQVSAYLDKNPVQCGVVIAASCLLGSAIPVGTVDLNGAPHAPLTLNNLQLVNQTFAPNCYGGLKFCFLFPIFLLKRKKYRV
jgi:hypothetical protein